MAELTESVVVAAPPQAVWDRVLPEFVLVDSNQWWRLYHRAGQLPGG